MSFLLVIKNRRAEDTVSPEFCYLFSHCLAQARKVFDAVAEYTMEIDSLTNLLNQSEYVLVMSEDNTFIGSRSLMAMKESIDNGAQVAIPSSFNNFPKAIKSQVYTLRAYECIEREIVEQVSDSPKPESHLPISLFSKASFQDLLTRNPLLTILDNSEKLTAEIKTANVASKGVYHKYIDYYGEIREDILPYLPKQADHILEIGCGRGLTGRLIQRELSCRVTGVELNSEVAKEAQKNIWRVIVGDVQTVEIPGDYDAIIATELFEHLNYPEEFLKRMKDMLKPGGRVVLSVPNVGHYSIVQDLLAGRWDYLPIGLLCYTHYRFFTRKTLEDWILRMGFASYDIIPRKTELPEDFKLIPECFEVDIANLSTHGFYVVLKN